jgi:hypothetical protein
VAAPTAGVNRAQLAAIQKTKTIFHPIPHRLNPGTIYFYMYVIKCRHLHICGKNLVLLPQNWQQSGRCGNIFSRRSSRAGAGTSSAEATVVGQVWGATLHAEELRMRTGVIVLARLWLLWHLCVWTFLPFVHSVTRAVIFRNFNL